MRHYILSISNVKGTGEIDAASKMRFLVSVKDDPSLALSSLLTGAVEGIMNTKPAGLSDPIVWSTDATDAEGSMKYDAPLLTDARFEVRELKLKNG